MNLFNSISACVFLSILSLLCGAYADIQDDVVYTIDRTYIRSLESKEVNEENRFKNENYQMQRYGIDQKKYFEGDIVTNKKMVTAFYGEEVAKQAEDAGMLQMAENDDDIEKEMKTNLDGDRRLGIITMYDMLWKQRDVDKKVIVPYEFQDTFPSNDRDITISQFKVIEMKTGVVKFVERTTQPDWVYIQRYTDECYSAIGRTGGKQSMNLGPGCMYGAVIHEMYHALGFFHEQSRSDRDDYVSILWDNIDPGYVGNFNKQTTNSLGSPYDYTSIMHYGAYFFGKVEWMCIPSKIKKNIAARIHLQRKDLDKNKDYCLTLDRKNEINGELYDEEPVILQPCTGGKNWKNQYWIVESYKSDSNILRSLVDPTFCLAPHYRISIANEYPMIIKKCVEGAFTYQKFIFDQQTEKVTVLRWQNMNDFVITRSINATDLQTYPLKIELQGISNRHDQEFTIEYSQKQTGRAATVNEQCVLTTLQTIDSHGNDIGQQNYSEQDIFQLQLLYQCPSGPRSVSSFCSLDCKCKLNQGNCTSSNQCEDGLKCEYDGKWINRCVSTAEPICLYKLKKDCDGDNRCFGSKWETTKENVLNFHAHYSKLRRNVVKEVTNARGMLAKAIVWIYHHENLLDLSFFFIFFIKSNRYKIMQNKTFSFLLVFCMHLLHHIP